MVEIILAFIVGAIFGVGAIFTYALWYDHNKKA